MEKLSLRFVYKKMISNCLNVSLIKVLQLADIGLKKQEREREKERKTFGCGEDKRAQNVNCGGIKESFLKRPSL